MSSVLTSSVDAEALPFLAGAARGELLVQRCRDSGRLLFPPRASSPWGRHREPEWVPVSGRGRIWSFVVPHPPLLPPFDALAPYNVILVALEEDPTLRMVGNLLSRPGGDIHEVDPGSIEIGAPVRVVFDRLTGDVLRPRWVLV